MIPEQPTVRPTQPRTAGTSSEWRRDAVEFQTWLPKAAANSRLPAHAGGRSQQDSFTSATRGTRPGASAWTSARRRTAVDEPPGPPLTVAETRPARRRYCSPSRAAKRTASPAPAPRPQAAQIKISHASGEAYAIAARGHTLFVDQPADASGGEASRRPNEAAPWLRSPRAWPRTPRTPWTQRGLRRDGLRIVAEFRPSPPTSRTTSAPIRVRIAAPSVPDNDKPWCSLWRRAAPCATPCSRRPDPAVALA